MPPHDSLARSALYVILRIDRQSLRFLVHAYVRATAIRLWCQTLLVGRVYSHLHISE